MDSSGEIEMQKSIENFSLSYVKKKQDGSLIISGHIDPANFIDTIAVGYDGSLDALGFVIDSSFSATRSFRLASPYYENMLDTDI